MDKVKNRSNGENSCEKNIWLEYLIKDPNGANQPFTSFSVLVIDHCNDDEVLHVWQGDTLVEASQDLLLLDHVLFEEYQEAERDKELLELEIAHDSGAC